MIVYKTTKKEFIKDVNDNQIFAKIYDKYQAMFGRVNESQQAAWRNSSQFVRSLLDDGRIPDDTGVAIEYVIPGMSKRIDLALSGWNDDGSKSVVVVELKQWSSCKLVPEGDGIVKTIIGGTERETRHPSYQALSYACFIKDYNDAVEVNNIKLYPCAFLHNYDVKQGDAILDRKYQCYLDEAPVFGAGDFEKLRMFISDKIKVGDSGEAFEQFEKGNFKPSKSLQDSLVEMIRGNKSFHLIDEQKSVYEKAKRMAKEACASNKKKVLIVKGGPGTGKTVLAINLLVDLINNDVVDGGLACKYVTKNSAPRSVFKKKLIGERSRKFIDFLFDGSGSFVNSQCDVYDVLIVDEAHRLNEKSGMFSNLGEDQTKEIINAAKFSVFFIDEHQRVTLKDVGSVRKIREFAEAAGAEVEEEKLASQFRCGGEDGYLAWIDNTLEIETTANFDEMNFNYDFRVFDDPNELRSAIVAKNQNNKARLVAGYCWDWIKQGQNDSLVHDIDIPEFGFAMSWNLNNTATWAIDPDSINEIGCIHTCQGLEFEYVGVIIGNDLRYENGGIVTDASARAKTDQSLKGLKKIESEDPDRAWRDADEIIKNTYRTLMTRGMKGCYVYCVDKGLAKYLKKRARIE